MSQTGSLRNHKNATFFFSRISYIRVSEIRKRLLRREKIQTSAEIVKADDQNAFYTLKKYW